MKPIQTAPAGFDLDQLRRGFLRIPNGQDTPGRRLAPQDDPGLHALSLGLNLLWEVAQLPLYRIPQDPGTLYAVYAVLHCTAGDVLIAVASFLVTVAALRDPDWPSSQPWRGLLLTTSCGFAYTVFSEWRNVYETGAWAYDPGMPLVLGIGLTPMLQWLVIPDAAPAILRVRARADRYMAHRNSGEHTSADR